MESNPQGPQHWRYSKIGLGLKLDSSLKVLEVVRGGPCDGKIKCGDVITHVDGQSVVGKTLQQIIGKTMGTVGSTSIVKVLRGDESEEVTVKRDFEVLQPKEMIKGQMKLGLKRRNDEAIKEVFTKYGDGTHIQKENLLQALKEFDVAGGDVSEEDAKNLEVTFYNLDRNNDGVLDFDEFKCAVQNPSPLENWTRSFPLSQLLADAILRDQQEHPLRAASALDDPKIDLVCEGFLEGLKRELKEQVAKLREAFAKTEKGNPQSHSSKFESNANKAIPGSIDDFHAGLSERIGKAGVELKQAMEAEHCHDGCCDEEFEVTEYMIKTTPSMEWGIVLGTKVCAETQMQRNRKIASLDELEQLPIVRDSGLTRPEIIAVVLGTGPMRQIYDTVLRRFPEKEYQRLKKSNNLYSSTIRVLLSAVQKLAHVTKFESNAVLYRGLDGAADLRELFFKVNQRGCSGFTEWGFVPTTSRMDVALKSAGAGNDGHPLPRVLAVQVGSMHRGAYLGALSQYEDEKEFLYPPCSFVEKAGPVHIKVTEFGVVEIIPVTISASARASSVEEMANQKKDMHLGTFRHHLHQLEVDLQAIATARQADNKLSSDKSAGEKLTVQGFLSRITEQCKDVISRQEAVSTATYMDDGEYRKLVVEMLDVKQMAISKLLEWLENTRSFIAFRWNAPLRTVHRRWLAILHDRYVAMPPGGERKDAANELCRAVGLVMSSIDVEEKNELGETRLMCAIAEGRSDDLKLLVEAGSNVNESRTDGASPLWLAAEFGRDYCIKALADLKADVNQVSNDRATPVYVAARNGHTECIRMLVGLKTDVNAQDSAGSSPLHQAAKYGYRETIKALVELGGDIEKCDSNGFAPYDVAMRAGQEECAAFIGQMQGYVHNQQPRPVSVKFRPLIISTGDISDVDGFYALAEYAKTGADCLFVMNYPGYIGINRVDANFAAENPGLGYKYSATEVLEQANKSPVPEEYLKFMERYQTEVDDNARMKSALTELAFAMANGVWNEVPEHGKLVFCIGGINAINPFSDSAIKNEVLVYSKLIKPEGPALSTKQGSFYDSDGKHCAVNWDQYSDIYLDFNGSLAFWNETLREYLTTAAGRIKGVFVMGGVYSKQSPVTMPSIPNVLNRFSSATMNQLYHPQNAADFFAFLAQYKIPAYTVANNTVGDLTTVANNDNKTKTFDGVQSFLDANSLNRDFLRALAREHYESRYNPPRKPFDYYTAYALTALIDEDKITSCMTACPKDRIGGSGQANGAFHDLLKWKEKTLFYSNVYGITFVSDSDDWPTTRKDYEGVVDTKVQENDAPFIKAKKEYFKKELEILKKIERLGSLHVRDLELALDQDKKLRFL